jgi:putative serine protease PepD
VSTSSAEPVHPGPPSRRSPLIARLAAAVLAAAVIASAAVTALLYAAGIAGGSTTSVAQSTHAPAGSTAADALDPSALYRGAAAGVVALEATGVGAGSNGLPYTPTGQSIDTGTGIVINTKGDILTASHVVAGASKITAKFLNGTVRAATVLGTDSSNDASVLHVNPAGLALYPMALGSSAALVVGDPLAVIGNPFGYNRSLSTGVVSGRDRTIQAPNGSLIANALQTDAAVNPGNSGGPLLDAQGQVVGIADQIATGSSGVDQSSGVGFAVPIDPVRAELSQLEAGRTVLHPYLGVGLQEASINRQGAQVTSVASGSPAAAAGLKAGELITALNGTAVTGPSQLVTDLAALKPGEKVTLTVKRGSASARLTATLSSQASRAIAG